MTKYSEFAPALLVETDGPVRVLTMNLPDQLNAFSDDLHDALRLVWEALADDPEAGAVVLTGAGRAFSSGGYLPNFVRNADDYEIRRRDLRHAERLFRAMVSCELPVVAAVNGPAVGLGCSLAVNCDIVLMAEGTFMSDPHVSVGLVAGDGGAVSWPLLTSLLKAKEYLLLGDRIPASECERLGLANRVVPAGELQAEARRIAHRLAAQPRQAVRDTKRALNLHLQHAADLVLPFALAAEMESFATPDLREKAAAFTAGT